MLFASLIVSFLLAQVGLARPRSLIRKQLGTWTLSNNNIVCSESSCSYSFDLSEDYTKQSEHCHFVINGTGNSKANRTDFQSVGCGQGSQYLINGGHMYGLPDVVLVITNVMEMTWAFFGYDESEFLQGPAKFSPSFPPGEYPGTGNEDKMGSLMMPDPQCGWTMTTGQRVIDDEAVQIKMTMMNDKQNKVSCEINMTYSMDTDAKTSSFYNQRCRNSDWTMSWGYHLDQSSAVMTMSDSNNMTQAWFGWTGVNSDIMLTATGTSVEAIICGV